MDQAERAALIEQYRTGYDRLVAALDLIPAEAWAFKPALNEWSIHEVLVHLADSEAMGAIRFRMMVSHPNATLMTYSGDAWPVDMAYMEQDWELALEGVKWAVRSTAAVLENMAEDIWTQTVIHPEYEEPLTFEQMLRFHAGHVDEHIGQINDNYKAWRQING